MDNGDPRTVIESLVAERGESYASLSRMLRRNDAYLQQFVRRGTPRFLAERDRKLLAAYFVIDEELLGAEAALPPAPTVSVRLLDLAASAGPGRLIDHERATAEIPFDREMLERLGIRSKSLAMLSAEGDSMAPTIEHGDQIMVDEAERRIGSRGGIYVIRLDTALMVKRVSRVGDVVKIASDNPAFPALSPRDAGEVDVIGKVVWLSRSLR